MSNLRMVSPGIWVGPTASIRTPHNFDLVIDCAGLLVDAPFPVEVATPSGKTAHTWTNRDLDRLVQVASPTLEAKGSVLLCCLHGRSRSATAASAILLAQGVAHDLDDAVTMVRLPGRRPAKSSKESLKRWWLARNLQVLPFPQTELFPPVRTEGDF
jgi:protein-tyrosine phosphatase